MATPLVVNSKHVLYLSSDDSIILAIGHFVKSYNCTKSQLYPFTFDSKTASWPIDIYNIIRNERQSHPRNLYVIIDYLHYFGQDSIIRAIKTAILSFPEVNFFFDETLKFAPKDCIQSLAKSKDIPDFNRYIFPTYNDFLNIDIPDSDFHSFDLHKVVALDNTDHSFKHILSKDNLFDASGLRLRLLQWKHKDLKTKDNFPNLHNSRSNNLCLCVEDERSQSLFNSYCLHANGFRVLPVTSAWLLREANKTCSPNIIIRDYDLQFVDEPSEEKWTNAEYKNELNTVDLIRGWKFDNWNTKNGEDEKNAFYWKTLFEGSYQKKDSKEAAISNPYWSHFEGKTNCPVFYVTNGIDKINEKDIKYSITASDKIPKKSFSDQNSRHAIVPGIAKPISGVYSPLWGLHYIKNDGTPENIVKETYRASKDLQPICTDRENHFHGAPLDVYVTVREMISRAREYYKDAKYVHAAIVSSDAIELLNGFHTQMTLKAIRIKALAENAMSANILGGDEEQLTRDTIERLERVKQDVQRYCGQDDKGINVLNQIYNDLRIFDQEKEHFYAEDAIVSQIAYENESFNVLRILKNLFRK